MAEGNTGGRVMRVPDRPGVVKDPGMCGRSLCGNREISSVAVAGSDGPHREGEEPKPMMDAGEKSDSAIVARKPTNKAGRPAAEPVERRAETEGNAGQQRTRRAQDRASVSQALDRIRQAARQRRKERFTALFHHISLEMLRTAFFALRREAAPGVDGLTWRAYAADLDHRIEDLHARVQRGAYRALPSRRRYIPKADGNQRPLAVAALEDKIVQRATAAVLNTIYEEDFLGFSYGFRPRRSQHDALDALVVGISGRKVNYILDADIRSFFDAVSQTWLIRFVEHRIGDRRIVRLIRKWLTAGVLEDGAVTVSETGTGQGSVISPLLANVYLHYVFDLWAQRWRRREATGDMIVVRYADDIIVGFEHETDAQRFRDAMRARLQEFSLSLHPDKTRLFEFGRHAAARRAQRGLGKPETFNFLGFTFVCGNSRRGRFLVERKTRRDRMRAKLREIKEEMRRRRHQPIPEQGKWLRQVVAGFFAYHAVPTNGRALGAFRYHVTNLWRRTLRRRSQKDRTTWARVTTLADDWLPRPRILHPWPSQRFAVKHPR
jgi:group II intron reverse transcriptase/maturase